MLKITAPRLVKNLREDVDWMDCISRQEDDFTECSFNGLCVEDVSKQNLSVNSCLFTNCGFIACNYRKSQFSDVGVNLPERISPNQSLIILPSGIAKEIM